MFPDVFLETGLEPSELMENVRKFPPGGWRSLENEGGKKKTLLPGRDMFLQTGYSIITPDIVPQHNPRHREQVREQKHHVDDDRDGGVQGGILKHRSAGDCA